MILKEKILIRTTKSRLNSFSDSVKIPKMGRTVAHPEATRFCELLKAALAGGFVLNSLNKLELSPKKNNLC